MLIIVLVILIAVGGVRLWLRVSAFGGQYPPYIINNLKLFTLQRIKMEIYIIKLDHSGPPGRAVRYGVGYLFQKLKVPYITSCLCTIDLM